MKIYELVYEREPQELGVFFDLEKAKRAALEHFNPGAPPGLVPVFIHPDKTMKAYDPNDWIWSSYLIIESETVDEPAQPLEVYQGYSWEGTRMGDDWVASTLEVAKDVAVDNGAVRDEIQEIEPGLAWKYVSRTEPDFHIHIVKTAVLDA